MNWDDIHKTTKIFNDPIYCNIELNPITLQFIDTPQFQRLRNIKQLGFLSYIFPSAVHTRFEHSIGTGHLATQLIKKFQINQPNLHITNRDIGIINIAATCHDLAHSIGSHLFDDLFIPLITNNYNYSHEQMGLTMLDYLIDDNYIDIDKNDIDIIKNIILGSKTNITKLDSRDFMYEIVANGKNSIDVDKIDYLSRDMHYLFGKYKTYNFNRLLKYNYIIDNTICYDSKVDTNIYDLFQQRYNMHKDIYNNKKSKAIDYMICDILLHANNDLHIIDSIKSPNKFMELTDEIIYTIKYTNNENLKQSQNIIKRLEKRDLYIFIDEYIIPKQLEDKIKKIKSIDIISMNSELSNLINVDDLIIFDKKINYNFNNKNPVDNVYFYNIKDKNNKYKKNKENISLLLPEIFEERILRVYSKVSDKYINDLVQTAFKRFIKQYN
jgi:deoxynucleoside triphosphate triphosphohydrolase SAMHD1